MGRPAMREMTYDAMALEIILGPGTHAERAKKLAGLRREADVAMGLTCPACDDDNHVEDNGETGTELVNLCTNCGHQWGPGTC